MSMKVARGTKRVCPSCGSKFYDLHRDPIVCPICGSTYDVGETSPRAGGNALDTDDDAVLDTGRTGIEFVSLDEVEATETEELPEIEGEEIAGVPDEEADLDTVSDDEAFLEADDESEDDVSDFVAGGDEDDHDR